MTFTVDTTIRNTGEITYEQMGPHRRGTLRAILTNTATAATATTSIAIPADANVVSVSWKYVSAIALTGGTSPTRLAIGYASDPDELALCSETLTAGTVGRPLAPLGADFSFQATGRPVVVTAVDTSGAATGAPTFTGTIAICIVFDQFARDAETLALA
jgi:hypothetical protein